MIFDKYTKIILTVIALALVSISLQITKSGFISSANAHSGVYGNHLHNVQDIMNISYHEH